MYKNTIYIYIHIRATVNIYQYLLYGSKSSIFEMCIIVFSGFGKPCSYSLYRIFIVFWWFSSRDKTLPDTFKCSPIKWNCRHHYHNHHYHITTTTITHHCHHLYHNHQHHNDNHHNHHNWWMLIFTSSTSGFWRKSRKKASFSHLQLSHILGEVSH